MWKERTGGGGAAAAAALRGYCAKYNHDLEGCRTDPDCAVSQSKDLLACVACLTPPCLFKPQQGVAAGVGKVQAGVGAGAGAIFGRNTSLALLRRATLEVSMAR